MVEPEQNLERGAFWVTSTTGLKFHETTVNSEMGIIRGFQTTDRDDDLFDCHQLIGNRPTHVSGRELDRILVSPSLVDEIGLGVIGGQVRRDLAIRGSEDAGDAVDYSLPAEEQDVSDHFPVVVTLSATGAVPPTDGGAPTREHLLEALQQIENQLRLLGEDVEEIRSLIEALD